MELLKGDPEIASLESINLVDRLYEKLGSDSRFMKIFDVGLQARKDYFNRYNKNGTSSELYGAIAILDYVEKKVSRSVTLAKIFSWPSFYFLKKFFYPFLPILSVSSLNSLRFP